MSVVLSRLALPFLLLACAAVFLFTVLLKLKEVVEHAVGVLVLLVASYMLLFPSGSTFDAIRGPEYAISFIVGVSAVISSFRRRFDGEDAGSTVAVRLAVAGFIAVVGYAAPNPANIVLRLVVLALALWMSVRPAISVVAEACEIV